MAFRPEGVFAVTVTPFHDDESLDLTRLQSHIEFLVASGVHGLVVAGGTGEYVSLSMDERKQVIACAIDVVDGRIPVVAGALSPGTRDVIEIGEYAAGKGAAGLLVLPPYYVRPSLEGIVAHYKAIAAGTGLSLIAYNNPGRIGWQMDVLAIEAIAGVPGVVGLKDSDRDVASILTKIRRVGGHISILSGDDDLGFATLLSGAVGGLWAAPNVAPRLCVEMYCACRDGDVDRARSLHNRLHQLVDAYFVVNHPGPLKEIMAMSGRPVGPARSPLQPMTLAQRKVVEHVLRDCGPFD
jgi:4-hydroxy-tetrahydrodipicolinate synthase